MNLTLIVLITTGLVIALFLAVIVYRRLPKKLNVDRYVEDWKTLQSYCKDRKTWPQAISDADNLLDKALKRRKFKGKRMGERMVSAQRVITNNDQLWFAHNLAKKIVADPSMKLKEADVKTALFGFRQALKDLGAMQQADITTIPAKKEDE